MSKKLAKKRQPVKPVVAKNLLAPPKILAMKRC